MRNEWSYLEGPLNQTKELIMITSTESYDIKHDGLESERHDQATMEDPSQTAQDLHSLPFRLHILDALHYDKATLIKFKVNYTSFVFWMFTAYLLPKMSLSQLKGVKFSRVNCGSCISSLTVTASLRQINFKFSVLWPSKKKITA